MNLKKIGNVLTSKSVGTGPSSYEKRSYRAVILRRFGNTAVVKAEPTGNPADLHSANPRFLSKPKQSILIMVCLAPN